MGKNNAIQGVQIIVLDATCQDTFLPSYLCAAG